MRRELRNRLDEKLAGSLALARRAEQRLASFYTTGPIGTPKNVVYFQEGRGARVRDVDGNEYVDLSCGIGVLILGHAHPAITEAACAATRAGVVHSLGNPHEVRLAELVSECVPGCERVTFVNSGTEATMHALKIARALTGRPKVAKLEGAYHGVHDYAQISGRWSVSGPPEAPESKVAFAGVPKAIEDLVLTLSYGYDESIARVREHAGELAAVIVEPVPTVCPIDHSAFLRKLREVTRDTGVVLIFDEVMSGFRMSLGGAQQVYGITPDLTTFGKLLGGGFPIGAIGGTRAAMDPLISSGQPALDARSKAIITGTFSGNPVTMAAGVATLEHLMAHPEIYPRLDAHAARIRTELEAHAAKIGFPLQLMGRGNWLVPAFDTKPIRHVRDVDFRRSAAELELLRHHALLFGVLLGDAPILFPSAVHTDEEIGLGVNGLKQALTEMM